MLKVILIVAGSIVALVMLDRLFLWMESRGWMYYRRTKGRHGGGAAGAVFEIHAALEPGVRHLLEERQMERAVQDESGDPPKPGPDAREPGEPGRTEDTSQ
jgi:hypothetical protein